MPITRRRFLASSAAAASVLGTPHPLLRALLGERAAYASPPDRILLIVQLEGGNDGLNTVVPVDGPQRTIYDTYRPNLGIPAPNLLGIGPDPVTLDQLGLHPALAPLKTLYDQGKVAVVNGVGYPGQSLSHFRSEDIWFGGIPSNQSFATGWFGRYLDATQPSGALVSLDCDNTLNPLFTCDDCNVLALLRLSDFVLPDDPLHPDLADKTTALRAAYAAERDTATGLQQRIGASGDVLLGKMDDYDAVPIGWTSNLNAVTGSLALRLKQIASVIRQDYTRSPASPTDARFFHVRLGGFDTHSNQGVLTGRHPDLWAQVSQALAAFWADMVALGVSDKVLVMTFSEFGRRPKENGGPTTAGTDHGAAAPLFVLGDGVVGGVHGRIPPLDAGLLENGKNLAWHTEFRSEYATVIQKWLGADPVPILNGSFPVLGFLP
jgi:uncharacterized protein (DUF1501 family)